MRASHSSSSSGGRAFSDGNEPTTPALHCAITRSGTEMMKSGEPITGIDRRPLNKAGMDIAERSSIGGQIEGWVSYQQGNLSTVKYCVLTPWRMPIPLFQVAEKSTAYPRPSPPSLRAKRSNPECLRGRMLDCLVARAPRNDDARTALTNAYPIKSGLISRSNENISSHFSCVSSLRSTTTIWCSDLPLL